MIAEHGLQRAGRYGDMIRRVLKEEGVPAGSDFTWHKQRSAFSAPKRCRERERGGIWQFMPYPRASNTISSEVIGSMSASDPEKGPLVPAARQPAGPVRNVRRLVSGNGCVQFRAYECGESH